MSDRKCGTCTACCEGWLSSKVTGMHPGNPCQFRTNKGCGIYASRPADPCKKFICAWLEKDSPLPESMRPDRAGMIVMSRLKWKSWIVIKVVATGSQIPATSMDWLREHAMQSGMPMIFKVFRESATGNMEEHIKGFGPPEFQSALRNGVFEDSS